MTRVRGQQTHVAYWLTDPEFRAFCSAIRENPDDNVSRLVAADWLQERGDAAAVGYAEFIRESVRCPKRLSRRAEALLDQNYPSWIGFIGRVGKTERDGTNIHVRLPHPTRSGRRSPSVGARLKWDRGFVGPVEIGPLPDDESQMTFEALAAEVRSSCPAASVNQPPATALPLELHWDSSRRPLPNRVLVEPSRWSVQLYPGPFDFCGRMRALCEDIVARCPALAHVRMSEVLVSATTARQHSPYGLQARVTPLRSEDGRLTRRVGRTNYRVQRHFVNGVEMLYVVTFVLPRFLDQPFEEKLITVINELTCMSPAFDGTLRRDRAGGHQFDEESAELMRSYLRSRPNPEVIDFLSSTSWELANEHDGIAGVVIVKPRLLPLGRAG